MSQISTEVWRRLTESLPKGETLTARLAIPAGSKRLFAAVDADSQRHLLITLSTHEASYKDNISRGMRASTRVLNMPGEPQSRYIDLHCTDATGYAAFDLIAGEISDQLARESADAATVVGKVIAKWRRFWSLLPEGILSRERLIGLFAELWFLSEWMFPRLPASEAVSRWRGPFGSRHDFEQVGQSIEVKGTTSTRGLIHRINGIDQLAPPEQGELLFFSLQLREEAGADNTLPKIVQQCRTHASEDSFASDLLEIALIQAKYFDAHSDQYNKLKLRVVNQALFRVEADFPRITRASFSNSIPAGIELVEYDVNLNGCSHLLLAESPAQNDSIAK